VLSKRSVFSTAIKLPPAAVADAGSLYRWNTAQHASQFVGDRDHDLVARSTLGEPVYPLPESSAVVLDAKKHGAGSGMETVMEVAVDLARIMSLTHQLA
jgi:hypothetical protein